MTDLLDDQILSLENVENIGEKSLLWLVENCSCPIRDEHKKWYLLTPIVPNTQLEVTDSNILFTNLNDFLVQIIIKYNLNSPIVKKTESNTIHNSNIDLSSNTQPNNSGEIESFFIALTFISMTYSNISKYNSLKLCTKPINSIPVNLSSSKPDLIHIGIDSDAIFNHKNNVLETLFDPDAFCLNIITLLFETLLLTHYVVLNQAIISIILYIDSVLASIESIEYNVLNNIVESIVPWLIRLTILNDKKYKDNLNQNHPILNENQSSIEYEFCYISIESIILKILKHVNSMTFGSYEKTSLVKIFCQIFLLSSPTLMECYPLQWLLTGSSTVNYESTCFTCKLPICQPQNLNQSLFYSPETNSKVALRIYITVSLFLKCLQWIKVDSYTLKASRFINHRLETSHIVSNSLGHENMPDDQTQNTRLLALQLLLKLWSFQLNNDQSNPYIIRRAICLLLGRSLLFSVQEVGKIQPIESIISDLSSDSPVELLQFLIFINNALRNQNIIGFTVSINCYDYATLLWIMNTHMQYDFNFLQYFNEMAIQNTVGLQYKQMPVINRDNSFWELMLAEQSKYVEKLYCKKKIQLAWLLYSLPFVKAFSNILQDNASVDTIHHLASQVTDIPLLHYLKWMHVPYNTLNPSVVLNNFYNSLLFIKSVCYDEPHSMIDRFPSNTENTRIYSLNYFELFKKLLLYFFFYQTQWQQCYTFHSRILFLIIEDWCFFYFSLETKWMLETHDMYKLYLNQESFLKDVPEVNTFTNSTANNTNTQMITNTSSFSQPNTKVEIVRNQVQTDFNFHSNADLDTLDTKSYYSLLPNQLSGHNQKYDSTQLVNSTHIQVCNAIRSIVHYLMIPNIVIYKILSKFNINPFSKVITDNFSFLSYKPNVFGLLVSKITISSISQGSENLQSVSGNQYIPLSNSRQYNQMIIHPLSFLILNYLSLFLQEWYQSLGDTLLISVISSFIEYSIYELIEKKILNSFEKKVLEEIESFSFLYSQPSKLLCQYYIALTRHTLVGKLLVAVGIEPQLALIHPSVYTIYQVLKSYFKLNLNSRDIFNDTVDNVVNNKNNESNPLLDLICSENECANHMDNQNHSALSRSNSEYEFCQNINQIRNVDSQNKSNILKINLSAEYYNQSIDIIELSHCNMFSNDFELTQNETQRDADNQILTQNATQRDADNQLPLFNLNKLDYTFILKSNCINDFKKINLHNLKSKNDQHNHDKNSSQQINNEDMSCMPLFNMNTLYDPNSNSYNCLNSSHLIDVIQNIIQLNVDMSRVRGSLVKTDPENWKSMRFSVIGRLVLEEDLGLMDPPFMNVHNSPISDTLLKILFESFLFLFYRLPWYL